MATADSTPGARAAGQEAPPRWLFVDLDGTLLRGDLLWEGLMGLLRSSPLALLVVPVWLFRGKARLKQRLAEKVDVAPEVLPFRQSVRDHLDAAHRAGRKIVLASASPMRWVRAVAEHLGRFDGVLASDAQVNLRGSAKLDAIREMTQGQPFEYVGDSSADLSVWRGAAVVTLVHRNARLERGLPSDSHLQWLDARHRVAWMDFLREMRPVQWIKNGLVFAPLILAHQAADTTRALATVV
ncbi:MAG: haloacid dehalogenase-like hydrolase, partial [Myxococcota bacterium]